MRVPAYRVDVTGCSNCPLASVTVDENEEDVRQLVCRHPDAEGRTIDHIERFNDAVACEAALPDTAPEFCPLRSTNLSIRLTMEKT